MKDKNDDPRKHPGSIAGPGDSHAIGEFIVDATNALLVGGVTVVKLDEASSTRTVIGLLLEGRINQTKDNVQFLALLNEDAMAAIITELIAITGRMGKKNVKQFLDDMTDRIKDLYETGNFDEK